jgi:hypothetical protein
MFDGLHYYFTKYPSLLESLSSPSFTTLFPLKIIASQYCLLNSFISFQTATMRSTGWALKRETPEEVRASREVELAWSRFRCSEYLEAIEAILDTLGIPYSDPPISTNIYNRRHDIPTRFEATQIETLPVGQGKSSEPNWRCHATDFLVLHRQFVLRRLDYDRITTSIAALMSIITGRLGIAEAQTVKTLTYVAMIFAPLAWISGIFGMSDNDEYGPGRPQFWKFWEVAIPTTLAVFLLFFVWHKELEMMLSSLLMTVEGRWNGYVKRWRQGRKRGHPNHNTPRLGAEQC